MASVMFYKIVFHTAMFMLIGESGIDEIKAWSCGVLLGTSSLIFQTEEKELLYTEIRSTTIRWL